MGFGFSPTHPNKSSKVKGKEEIGVSGATVGQRRFGGGRQQVASGRGSGQTKAGEEEHNNRVCVCVRKGDEILEGRCCKLADRLEWRRAGAAKRGRKQGKNQGKKPGNVCVRTFSSGEGKKRPITKKRKAGLINFFSFFDTIYANISPPLPIYHLAKSRHILLYSSNFLSKFLNLNRLINFCCLLLIG